MGFGSFIRKVGRAVDPTSKTSPLGGLARSAIGFVPGGSAALGAVSLAGKVVKPGSPGVPAAPAAPAAPVEPSSSMPAVARSLSFFTTGTGLAVSGLVLAALVAALVLVRRRR